MKPAGASLTYRAFVDLSLCQNILHQDLSTRSQQSGSGLRGKNTEYCSTARMSDRMNLVNLCWDSRLGCPYNGQPDVSVILMLGEPKGLAQGVGSRGDSFEEALASIHSTQMHRSRIFCDPGTLWKCCTSNRSWIAMVGGSEQLRLRWESVGPVYRYSHDKTKNPHIYIFIYITPGLMDLRKTVDVAK